jgi:hypothetical protein
LPVVLIRGRERCEVDEPADAPVRRWLVSNISGDGVRALGSWRTVPGGRGGASTVLM